MAIICPYKVNRDNFDKVCSREFCTLWHEPLEMCSHKATALLLYDIHHIIIKLGLEKGFVNLPEEEKNEEKDH